MKELIHRDQVHSDVYYDPLSVALLDTAPLQRLGKVYQLGYAHLVYRGGNHTRLSHVMGTYHVAGELVEALREKYSRSSRAWPYGAVDPSEFLPGPKSLSAELRWDILLHLVRWASLLHDVSHIPLGHTLEDEFSGIYPKHDDFTSPRIQALWFESSPGKEADIRRVFRQTDLYPHSFQDADLGWEQVWQSVLLICLYEESKNGQRNRKTFKELISKPSDAPFVALVRQALNAAEGKTFFPYMADIVGNTICADYLDYLQRDSSNLGLDVLSYERLISRFWIGRDNRSQLRMALALVDRRGKPRFDTITSVVELVRQRYRFAESVYYHKAKVSASAMFAKVFHLIGTPSEVPPQERDYLKPSEIVPLAQDMLRGKREKREHRLKEIHRIYFPSALLDPEIGDESLHLLMVNRAWDGLERAAEKGDGDAIVKNLRAVAILQAIARRKLYKVCFSLNKESFVALHPGSKEDDDEVERRLEQNVLSLRSKSKKRDQLETAMSRAAGLLDGTPPIYDSFILYVPPRKSQAKGIETGALDNGEVVTLGKHSAVIDQARELNKKYAGLWKLLLFVHPDHQQDSPRLSLAVDELVKSIFPNLDLYDAHVVATLKSAAWFDYLPVEFRGAAQRYLDLLGVRKPRWSHFDSVRSATDGLPSQEEYAYRALLLDLYVEEPIDSGNGIAIVRKHFGKPGSLGKRVDDVLQTVGTEGFEGETDEARVCHALEIVAHELASLSSPQLRFNQT